MDSGNSDNLQSSSGHGDAGYVNPSSLAHFNHIPIRSNYYNPSSFSQPPNPNPNPSLTYDLNPLQNSNPIYVPDTPKDPNSIKNPKKRTRASRRAPTTVMTTDTTNFRRMVQQYTGIPDAPFATSSSASSFTRRNDIFAGGMSPVQPLRPSATYLNSGSNLQLAPSENYNITKQPLNLSNLNNQMFPFQSVSSSTLPLHVNNVTEVTEHSDPFVGSSLMKRWRGQNENFGNSQNVVVSVRNNDNGDQLTGNEDSWICPSD